MATGTLPFNESNTIALIQMILAGEYSIPYFVSPIVAHLIHKMLKVDPKKRIKINKIRSHLAFKTMCPSLFVSLSSIPPLLPFKDSEETIGTWDDGSNLDTRILEDLHTLGWGDVKELKTMLISDKVKKKSSIPIYK
jgi:serine/threonine protein kinase